MGVFVAETTPVTLVLLPTYLAMWSTLDIHLKRVAGRTSHVC
jgi:hypothetical protein